jgi:hypothetical protein
MNLNIAPANSESYLNLGNESKAVIELSRLAKAELGFFSSPLAKQGEKKEVLFSKTEAA